MIYTSATLSLAALERLVHTDPDLEPPDLAAIAVDIGAEVRMGSVEIADLPANWREYPAPEALARIGELWSRESRTAVLAVPSAVIPHERNYVLNPNHADFAKLTIAQPEPFSFDPRMWRKWGRHP